MAIIALDIGGTKIEGAVIIGDGTMPVHSRTLLCGRAGQAVADVAVNMADSLVGEADKKGMTIDGIGVCVPGIVDRRSGTVWAPNIPGWERFPLQDHLQKNLNQQIGVWVDSDRSCAIYGETWLGAAADCDNAIFVAVGTGIGLGIKVDGHVLHGAGDIAGAAGWMALQPPFVQQYEQCGCLEYYASGTGIGRHARELLECGEQGECLGRGKPVGEVDSHDVFLAYDHGDSLAARVLDKAVEMWGMAAANLVSLFNPEVMVWGGGVFGPAVKLIPRIYDEAVRWAQPVAIKQVGFVASHTGINAILLGAAYVAFKNSRKYRYEDRKFIERGC